MEVTVYGPDGMFLSKTTTTKALKLLDTNRAISISAYSIQIKQTKKDTQKMKHRIIEQSHRICYICGRRIPEDEIATVDHIIPKSRDKRAYDERNMRCCCERCNNDKGNMTLKEYIEHIRRHRKRYKYLKNETINNLGKFAERYEKKFFAKE